MRPITVRSLALVLLLTCATVAAKHWGQIIVTQWASPAYRYYTIAQDRVVEWQAASTAWRNLYGTVHLKREYQVW